MCYQINSLTHNEHLIPFANQDTHDGAGSPGGQRGWTPRNWNKKTEAELRKLPPVLKSRYLAVSTLTKEDIH